MMAEVIMINRNNPKTPRYIVDTKELNIPVCDTERMRKLMDKHVKSK